MSFEVEIADPGGKAAWDEFVERSGVTHHAHLWFWRGVFATVFGHEPYYLIARDSASDSSVAGILPLFLVRSVLFGRALISLPYLNGGGLVATSEEARLALLQRAAQLAKELEVNYVELRERAPLPATPFSLVHRSHKVSMLLPLNGDAQALFEGFPAKLRSQIRRPSKAGMSAEVSSDLTNALRLVRAFYEVFAENMRDLGTPVYPRRLFEQTLKSAGRRARVIVVWHEGRPVGCGITIGVGSTVEIPWASTLKRHNKSSPNMLLYWQAIKSACEDGYEHFDFGRCSPDSGSFKFKEQWGAKALPLHWYYLLNTGKVPDVNPKRSGFTPLVSAWRRLPLPVANLVGPWLTKSIP